jgi:hypothetical protein
MKYTFESSETEVTELYGLLGLIAREVGKTVRHSNELRARRPEPRVEVVTVEEPDMGIVEGEDKADVLPFIRPVEPPRTTEKELEDNLENEPEPLPEEMRKHFKTVALGEKKFSEFISTWLVGIDHDSMALIEGVDQPNRERLLRDLCNGPYAFPVLQYVRSKGGLQQAIFAVSGDKALARRLPDFIVPPASIVFSDLADTYEYVNPWKDEE